MIRLGNVILNEDCIAAIQPAMGMKFFDPKDDFDGVFVHISNVGPILVKATMEEAVKVLERVGLLEPANAKTAEIEPWIMFTPGELDEFRTRYEQGFRFAAKDQHGQAFVYSAKPMKGRASWINSDCESRVCRLRGGFDALSFDDDEPLEISALLAGMG